MRHSAGCEVRVPISDDAAGVLDEPALVIGGEGAGVVLAGAVAFWGGDGGVDVEEQRAD
jgi:hypothetical protein